MRNGIFAAMLMATPLPTTAETVTTMPQVEDPAAANCVSHTVPWMSFEVQETTENGTMLEVTGRTSAEGGALMRASRVRCTNNGIEAEKVAFFPDAGVMRLLDEGTGLMADLVRIDAGRNPCTLGAIPEIRNARLFHWRKDGKGVSEIVMRINGEDIYRPLVYKIAFPTMSFMPKPSAWPCGVSGDFHTEKPVISVISGKTDMRLESSSAMLTLSMPLDPQSYNGVPERDRPDAEMSVFFSYPTLGIGTSPAVSADSAHLDIRLEQASPFVSFLRRYVPEAVLPQEIGFPIVPFANLSNVLGTIKGSVTGKVEGVSMRPLATFGRIFPGNYEGFTIVTGSMSGSASISEGVISGNANLMADGLATVAMSAGIAPRRFVADDLEPLTEGRGPSPFRPKRVKVTIVGQDSGLSGMMSSIFGFDMAQLGPAADFFRDMRRGSATMKISVEDPDPGRSPPAND